MNGDSLLDEKDPDEIEEEEKEEEVFAELDGKDVTIKKDQANFASS